MVYRPLGEAGLRPTVCYFLERVWQGKEFGVIMYAPLHEQDLP